MEGDEGIRQDWRGDQALFHSERAGGKSQNYLSLSRVLKN
jgi:hypothetical protein